MSERYKVIDSSVPTFITITVDVSRYTLKAAYGRSFKSLDTTVRLGVQ